VSTDEGGFMDEGQLIQFLKDNLKIEISDTTNVRESNYTTQITITLLLGKEEITNDSFNIDKPRINVQVV